MMNPRVLGFVVAASALGSVLAQDGAPSIEARVAAMTARIDAARMEQTVRDLVGFHSRQVLSATDDPERGTGAARRYLEARYRELVPSSGGRLAVTRDEHEVVARRLRIDALPIVNIVAVLEGTSDPDRIYLVSGHYDSINGSGADGEGQAPGANDDGSGTAVALEVCRALCKEDFAATLVFVAYDGEEQGLLGSSAHARALAEAGASLDGMITNDIVGNTLGMDGVRRRGYVRGFSYSPVGNDSPGRSLARAAAFAARRHVEGFEVRLVFRGDRYGRGGDHRPFYSEGWPAMRLTEPREDYSRQHQNVTERDGAPYGDLPRFMDFDYMAKVASVNVATLAELASAPRAPASARARGARDAYDVRLSWEPVESAADYELVWRETTAADWQASRLVSDLPEPATRGRRGDQPLWTVTLPDVCLDEVIVGVRSVGADGSRSRVTTPPEPDSFNLRRTGGGR